ncbi:MAG: PD-(D/E)XK nuclease family protein [Clostridia bacterium]|nr:PD-(D/E)XK nuclease family protein [Clostridia bacterium]
MITVLYGKMGTGKSTHIMEQIKNDCKNKKQSFLIVPEQKAIIAEREIAETMPPSAQLYTEATNFSRLANSVFRKHGGLAYNYITRSGKRLIMYRTLCELRDSLTSYKIPKGRERGAVEMFLDAVGELKTYGISTDKLEAISESTVSSKLYARVKDLSLVRSVYEKILSEKFNDPYDDILLLAEKLKSYEFFKGANVYVDSFYGFTGAQWNVLYEIAKQCDNLVIALDMPKDGKDSDYAKIVQTSRSLEKMCRNTGTHLERISFDTDYLHKNPTIKYLYDNLWDFGASPIEEHTGVTLVTPEDEFDECEYVASEIKRLVMQGARYSDIAVIMGKADTYNGIIDMTFDKYEIPSFFAKQTDISAKPLVKMIFSAINTVDSYRLQDISDYLKCGYSDIDVEHASELEGYMYRWKLQGRKKFDNDEYWNANPDGYVVETTESQLEELARINETRGRLAEALLPLRDAFDKKLTCRDTLIALYRFLENHKIREKLDKEIKESSKEEAIELSQLYSGLISAFDTVNEIMGGEILDAESFAGALRYALDGVKVGVIPTGEDKVTVGEAYGIRTKNIAHVFILGAISGKFPGTVVDDGYFTDRDKIELEGVDIVLSSKSDIKSADELLNFRNAIAVASESVCISAPRGSIGSSTPSEPSIGYERVKKLLYNATEKNTSAIPLYERIFTERVAKEYASFGRNVGAEAIRSLLNIERSNVDFANESICVGEKEAREIFTTAMNMSYSRIETFVLCHFKYYCNYLLKLRENTRISFSSRDVGDLTHKVFELFFLKVKEDKIDLSALEREDIIKLVDEIIDEYIKAICRGSHASSRMERLFDRLRKHIYIFIESMVKEFSESKFLPEYFELSMGNGENDVPSNIFKVGENATLAMRGSCDRVDVYRKDKDTFIRVIDYKTGSKEYNRADAEKGLNLQLLIYLYSLCKMGDCKIKQELGGEITPAGMMYIPLEIGKARNETEKGIATAEGEKNEVDAIVGKMKRSGLLLEDKELLSAQDPSLEGKYIPTYPPRANSKEETFVSRERFEEIFGELADTIEEIGLQMLSGDARAEHLERKDNTSPCKYCANRAVCRRRK